ILRIRESVALRYAERLKNEPRLLLPDGHVEGGRVSWFVYVVRLAERFTRAQRDRVVREMREQGIGCGRYFAPIHLQPLYVRSFGHRAGEPGHDDLVNGPEVIVFRPRVSAVVRSESVVSPNA